jgi:hypothetical protein
VAGRYAEEVGDYIADVVFQQNGAIVYLNKHLELGYNFSEKNYGD